MSDTDATCKRNRVADLLREYASWLYDHGTIDEEESMTLHGIADQIDREHERRMEQQSHDLRKAWLSQQRTQLELEALRVKATEEPNEEGNHHSVEVSRPL